MEQISDLKAVLDKIQFKDKRPLRNLSDEELEALTKLWESRKPNTGRMVMCFWEQMHRAGFPEL